MINIRTIKKLANNDGLTLKKGEIVNYKTGWQVADYGKEAHNAEEAMRLIKEYKGDCGVWLADGIYYIDHSFRVKTKKKALELGKMFNQISVFGWKKKNLVFCNAAE